MDKWEFLKLERYLQKWPNFGKVSEVTPKKKYKKEEGGLTHKKEKKKEGGLRHKKEKRKKMVLAGREGEKKKWKMELTQEEKRKRRKKEKKKLKKGGKWSWHQERKGGKKKRKRKRKWEGNESTSETRIKPWGKNKKIRQGAIISAPGYYRLIYLFFLLFDYLSMVNWIWIKNNVNLSMRVLLVSDNTFDNYSLINRIGRKP
jgi:hypothetical protein